MWTIFNFFPVIADLSIQTIAIPSRVCMLSGYFELSKNSNQYDSSIDEILMIYKGFEIKESTNVLSTFIIYFSKYF